MKLQDLEKHLQKGLVRLTVDRQPNGLRLTMHHPTKAPVYIDLNREEVAALMALCTIHVGGPKESG